VANRLRKTVRSIEGTPVEMERGEAVPVTKEQGLSTLRNITEMLPGAGFVTGVQKGGTEGGIDFLAELMGLAGGALGTVAGPADTVEERAMNEAISGTSSEVPLPKEKPPVPDDFNKNFMFNKVLERLGVESKDQEEAIKNLEKFAELTRNTESSNNYKAENIPVGKKKKTSAKGAYQFLDGSIVPAINRLERLIGEQPWMSDLRKSNNIFSLTDKQQDLLFFGDMFEKTVDKTKGLGDNLLKKIVRGDKNAMFEMYKKAHHTGKLPPEAEKNARRKFLQEDNNKKQGGSIVERNPYNYQPKAI